MPAPGPVTNDDEFARNNNSQGIPESTCMYCFHIFIAPTMEALELLETNHNCWEKQNSGGRLRPARRAQNTWIRKQIA